MRGGTTQPILSEDLWARAASGLNSCHVSVFNCRSRFGNRLVVYGQGKRLRRMGYGWASLNLSAVCGRPCLNLAVPDA